MKKLKNKYFKNIIIFLMASITTLTYTFNFTDAKNITDLNNPLKVSVLITFILIIVFYKLYNSYYFKKKDNSYLFNFLALLFAIFMVVGYSYNTVGDASLIFDNILVFIISFLNLLGHFLLFNVIIHKLFYYIINFKDNDKLKKNKLIKKIFIDHPFISTFLIILICWLPYLIAYFPGILSPDPSFQIEQFLGIKTKYSDYTIMLDENVTITNHHPITHTVLLGSFAKLGLKMGSINWGIFLYTLIQTIALISLFSYIILYFKKLNTPLIIRILSLIIYSFTPVFPFYAISPVKDVYFAIFVILYIIRLFDLIKYQNFSLKNLSILSILMLLITLFRNNGIYLIIMSFPFMLLAYPKKGSKLLITFLIPVICYYSFTNVLLPHLKITPGSIRETLSLPFQQTARYVKYHSNEVTEEEKMVIDKVLEYDTLATRYKTNIADPVKNKYNKYSTNEDLNNYLKVWWIQFKKHPGTYFNATMANTYGYIYPDTHNWYIYHKYYSYLKDVGLDYHYNNLENLRNGLYYYGEVFPYIPGLGMIVNIGFATWLWMLIFTYLIKLKKYKYLIITCPVISIILVCFAGPVNTYFRYTLSYVFAIPIIIAIFLNILEGVKKDEKNRGFNTMLQ